MALTVSAVQSCGVYIAGKRLRGAIIFEAERGYRNALGRTMRISKICSRSKHKFTEKLLEEVDGYDTTCISDRLKLYTKVAALMGYDSLQNLIENEASEKRSGLNLKDAMDYFDVSLARQKFPSIIVGSSPPVKLYDDTTHFPETRSILVAQGHEAFHPNFDPDSLGKALPSLYADLSIVNSNAVREESSFSWHQSPSLSMTSETEVYSSSQDTLERHSTNVDFSNVNCDGLREENSLGRHQSPQSRTLKTEEYSCSVDTVEEPCINVCFEPSVDIASVELFLDKSITCIPELSKRNSRQLDLCGFHTLRKLLHHFPRSYVDLRNAQVEVEDGQYLIFIGKVLSSRGIRVSSSFSFLEVVVGSEVADKATFEYMNHDSDSREKRIIYLHLKKFFRGKRFTNHFFLKRLQEKHELGELVCVSGKVRSRLTSDHYELREYNIDVLKDEEDSSLCTKGRPYPIYPSKGGLNPNFLRDIIAGTLQTLPVNIDPIPTEIIQEFRLLNLFDAYIGIHQPKSSDEVDLARKRFIFDEFFYLQLGRLYQMLEGLGTQREKEVLLDKYRNHELSTVCMENWSSLTKKFLKTLPFSLTSSQLNAVSEIIQDLKQPVPMKRLLQGDVGCGKTVVAFLTCMEVIGSGYQAAFMVPTELLAVQHYEHLLKLLNNLEGVECKPSISLLTGSTPLKQSRMIRQDLQNGNISLVIGTHSLIAEKVEFSALRIAVVDEQHRFGVIQRGRFNNKLYHTSISSRMAEANLDESSKGYVHMAPHVLAMSATPIPRTLALALYGDISLTQIIELPPGRIPVETYTVEGDQNGFENVYTMMLDELKAGGKVYLVYPVIQQSEQLPQLRAASADLEAMSDRFQGYNCGLLHGKLKGEDRDEALRRFRSGETHILLSTPVIEVGVDVPDASMMVVMNAERFGIAQLHQLRGRVGRGVRKSKCILIASTAGSLDRLKVLEKSSDGFYLANVDLLLRGPGDLLGKKQSGHLPDFPIARLEVDGNILQDAHLAALKIIGVSHDLTRFPVLKAELSMRQPLCLLGD
ncbi:DEAD domain-containing protein/Helicase_C domain-containing protein [Cephalotus follicularis]|uniref:DNA 3'-5' helicase n=1 Tax=Cephalotus follicularis TaxID=3775 RepID=A0A1Q3C7F5_CEPFO|nr:DEAD domain-containing protein/Helicase_C domain-containing protein [Cephalotus follicularis]